MQESVGAVLEVGGNPVKLKAIGGRLIAALSESHNFGFLFPEACWCALLTFMGHLPPVQCLYRSSRNTCLVKEKYSCVWLEIVRNCVGLTRA